MPGSNFVLDMHNATTLAERTILVLSPSYLNSLFTQPEWAAFFAKDPTGEKYLVVPVLVQDCELKGLLSQIVYIDLRNLSESLSRDELLSGIKIIRKKPNSEPFFPGTTLNDNINKPTFPGTLPSIWKVPYHRNLNFTGRKD